MDQKQPLLESDEGFFPLVPDTKRKRNIISLLLAAYSLLVSIAFIILLSSGNQSGHNDSFNRPKCMVFVRCLTSMFHSMSIVTNSLTIHSHN